MIADPIVLDLLSDDEEKKMTAIYFFAQISDAVLKIWEFIRSRKSVRKNFRRNVSFEFF